MNSSQQELYERIIERYSDHMKKVDDLLTDLELVFDHAELTDRQHTLINEAFNKLVLAIQELSNSI